MKRCVDERGGGGKFRGSEKEIEKGKEGEILER